ncbi:MAG TPA: glycine C-acetyltransferase [Nitrolancea sp.]|jgi:glycine C-acetyltransferase|nr:glycine C-acetyltransferase [Nitrolancea sp.]
MAQTGTGMSFLTTEIEQLKEQGLHRSLRVIGSPNKPVFTVDGKEVINLSSNNYLGLTTHPKLIAASVKATEWYGVGSGAVRTIAGTMTLHEELERRLADFKHTEASLTFQSGFTANTGVLQSLLKEEDVIISDQLNHASIIDGIRLSRAQRKIFPHKDMDGLESALKETQSARVRLIVTDGVFSMDGDIAPMPQIVDLAERYGAIVMIDDAHGSGVLGKNGRGTVNHFDLDGRVQIQIGTLSKAIGAVGGYVAGDEILRDYLIHMARPFLFSTSQPPGVVASCIAAIDVLEQEPEIVDRLWENTRFFKQKLTDLGFNTGRSETPITPVIVGEAHQAMALSDKLFERGVFAQGIGYPTVAKGQARLRTMVSAAHTKEQLQQALDAIAEAGKELGII